MRKLWEVKHVWAYLEGFFSDPALAGLTAIFVGAAITWLVARAYYKKAGDELRAEAALLRKANMAIVYMLEHQAADIEVRRDGAGNAIGLVVPATGRARGGSTTNGVGASERTDC